MSLAAFEVTSKNFRFIFVLGIAFGRRSHLHQEHQTEFQESLQEGTAQSSEGSGSAQKRGQRGLPKAKLGYSQDKRAQVVGTTKHFEFVTSSYEPREDSQQISRFSSTNCDLQGILSDGEGHQPSD